MDQSLIRRCGPQFGPDERVRRGGHREGMKMGRTAFHSRWIYDSGKRCQVVEDVYLKL
jgi:hypothetical protein